MNPKLKKRDKYRWQLREDLQVSVCDVDITIVAGFITDGASIPESLQFLFPDRTKKPKLPAIIHDYLYAVHLVDKAEADLIFLELLKRDGVSLIKRWAMYLAVVIFGYHAWRKKC